MYCCRRWVDGFDDGAGGISRQPDVSAHQIERADGSIARTSPSRKLQLSNMNAKQSETLDSVSDLLHSRNHDIDAGPRFAGDELSRIARTTPHNASITQPKGDSIASLQGNHVQDPPLADKHDTHYDAKYKARVPHPRAEPAPHPPHTPPAPRRSRTGLTSSRSRSRRAARQRSAESPGPSTSS